MPGGGEFAFPPCTYYDFGKVTTLMHAMTFMNFKTLGNVRNFVNFMNFVNVMTSVNVITPGNSMNGCEFIVIFKYYQGF